MYMDFTVVHIFLRGLTPILFSIPPPYFSKLDSAPFPAAIHNCHIYMKYSAQMTCYNYLYCYAFLKIKFFDASLQKFPILLFLQPPPFLASSQFYRHFVIILILCIPSLLAYFG